MEIPLVGPLWTYFTSCAWDVALNLSEMAVLGRNRWYWRLHANAKRLYWKDPAVHVVMREAAAAQLPAEQCVYGETPAMSFLSMLKRIDVTADDTLIDLGCGRGLALLAAAAAFGLHGVGIDVMPTFIDRANEIARRMQLETRVHFISGDFLQQDLSRGTIFYAASTTFVRDIIDDVAARVAQQADTTHLIRFITLSQPLLPPWKLVAKATYPMMWGRNSVYFHALHGAAPGKERISENTKYDG